MTDNDTEHRLCLVVCISHVVETSVQMYITTRHPFLLP